MATKANTKPCKTFEMELFPQVVAGFRGELRILQKSQQIKAFCKTVNK